MNRREFLELGGAAIACLGRRATAAASLSCLLAALPAAALHSVSGTPDPAVDGVLVDGAREAVSYSLANGFPLWYRDTAGPDGLKLQLCLDQLAELTPGIPSNPCLAGPPFPAYPVSFPLNFGTEGIYWTASTFQAFASTATVDGVPTVVPGGFVLVVLSLEASFQNLIPIDGEQAVFQRIRIRADVPQPGTYLVTHPYGEVIYVAGAVTALEREISQTQDLGNMPPAVIGAPIPPGGPPPQGDFTLALRSGAEPPVGPFDPAIDVGVVSSVATSIGPFLRPAALPGGEPLPPITATSGARYLADPGTDVVPLTVPVTGSPLGPGSNRITLTLLDPPPGFALNALDGTQTIAIDRFQVAGRLFDDGPNAAPVAVPDVAVTAKGVPVEIDVVANDVDPVDAVVNRHGIDPQAIGLPSSAPGDLPGTILLSRPLATAHGGTVWRTTTLPSGKALFLYTPAAGFSGVDTFEYVVQDTGGRLSDPATVTVLVGELVIASAEVRTRTGRWHVRGTSSATAGDTVTLFGSPRAVLTGGGVVPPVATGARGAATFSVRPDAIDFSVAVDPLPASPITAVTLHLGLPGESGPMVLFAYDEPVDGPFPGSKAGTLTEAQLLPVPGQPDLTFADVAEAVMAGAAYVEVRTAARPGGELRGQIASPLVGTAPVDPVTRAWSFRGPSRTSPGGAPASVRAVSSNGIRAAAVPLRLR